MEALAIIPARGGSKAVPRKNLALLNGKPLIWWTIAACLRSAKLRRIVVSTEDAEIACVAQAAGAEVLSRPDYLAGDDVHASLVALDVITTLHRHEGYWPDVVAMLLPTSPFRTATHIDEALDLWRTMRCEAVVGVYTICGHTLETIRGRTQCGYLQLFTQSARVPNRQQHTPLYRVNGAIFVCSARDLLRDKTFHQKYTVPYIMPEHWASLEIDTKEDLKLARELVKEGIHCA